MNVTSLPLDVVLESRNEDISWHHHISQFIDITRALFIEERFDMLVHRLSYILFGRAILILQSLHLELTFRLRLEGDIVPASHVHLAPPSIYSKYSTSRSLLRAFNEHPTHRS